MKKLTKTFATTLLASLIAFGAVSTANAMSSQAQEALGKAQITAAQALSTAQGKVGADAKVKEVDFKHANYGKDYFQVEMFANGQKHKVDVDANSGEVLDVKSKAPKKVKVTADTAAPQVSMAQAMDTALAKTGGKVAEANLERRGDKALYKIEAINNGQEFVVAVDANSGQIIDMPKKDKHHKHHKKAEHRDNAPNTGNTSAN